MSGLFCFSTAPLDPQAHGSPHARPGAAEDGGAFLVVLEAVARAVRREGGVVARGPAPARELSCQAGVVEEDRAQLSLALPAQGEG